MSARTRRMVKAMLAKAEELNVKGFATAAVHSVQKDYFDQHSAWTKMLTIHELSTQSTGMNHGAVAQQQLLRMLSQHKNSDEFGFLENMLEGENSEAGGVCVKVNSNLFACAFHGADSPEQNKLIAQAGLKARK